MPVHLWIIKFFNGQKSASYAPIEMGDVDAMNYICEEQGFNPDDVEEVRLLI